MLRCASITDRLNDRSKILLTLFSFVLIPIEIAPAIAQIVPDNTLGAESSRLTPLDTLTDRIDGGAIRGSNLFHLDKVRS
jgi:hypothetical protein